MSREIINNYLIMKNLEEIIRDCCQEIGKEMVCQNQNYIKVLIDDGKKIEGWFQVNLASLLYKKLLSENNNKVFIEKLVVDNRYADICIEENNKSTFVEIKFLNQNRDFSEARKKLINEIKRNNEKNSSYGIAVVICPINSNWMNDELKRIEDNCKIKGLAFNCLFSFENLVKIVLLKLK